MVSPFAYSFLLKVKEASMNRKEIASKAGITTRTLTTLRIALELPSFREMTEVQQEYLLAKAIESKSYRSINDYLRQTDTSKIKFDVRRIDKKDTSSLLDLLQDCKERYVANEKLIQRLQYELDNTDNFLKGSGNGTLQIIPQLSAMEKYQKLNISLRNQIKHFEDELGRQKYEEEDDPFN